MSDQQRPDHDPTVDLDPGAYIGSEPERAEETIPGGVGPQDERIAAYDSRPGAPGEPDDSTGEVATSGGQAAPGGTEMANHTPDDDTDPGDVVEGPVGSASLKLPDELAHPQG